VADAEKRLTSTADKALADLLRTRVKVDQSLQQAMHSTEVRQ
jgi:hypothetical protein